MTVKVVCCIAILLSICGDICCEDPPEPFEEPPVRWPEDFSEEKKWVEDFPNVEGASDEAHRHRRNNIPHDYALLIENSLRFYEAQRSGKLSDDNRIKWRGDSALGDVGDNGEDLTGGYYDAGDNLKFNLPMAYSTSVIGYSLMIWKDGYKAAAQYWKAMDMIKWACDYFIKCYDKTTNVYYYQVGNDHSEWQRPEDMQAPRPAYKCDTDHPGSDVAGATAAALATCAAVWKTRDPDYSTECRSYAESLYEFAMTYRGTYPSMLYYMSTRFGDELAWAAGLLYLETENTTYLDDAEELYVNYTLYTRSYAFGWGDVREAVKVLLWRATNDEKYSSKVGKYLDPWMPGVRMRYTAGGMAYRHKWGSLRYSSANAFIALLAAESGINPDGNYTDFACNQINYILGENPNDQSYVIGYGNNYPKQPHHRASSCPAKFQPCTPSESFGLEGDNPNELTGALVGGPDANDFWEDSRYDYEQNEVACDYNAGFQATLAGLMSMEARGILPDSCKVLAGV